MWPARRAVCGGGTRWSQLDAATQEHGLATPGGFISHTGVAGLTLGGGLGWLSRKAGLSSDNLLSVEIVTADGGVLRASPDDNPDLFWAVRGGGGNFGVVTAFEFRLHEVGPIVQLGLSFWDLDHGPDAFRAARDMVESLPDDIAVFLAALNAPPAPFVPEVHQGALGFVVILVGYGPADEHARSGRPPAAAAPPLFAFDTPIPYTMLQQMFDESAPWGIRGYEKAVYLDELSDGAIDVIAQHFPRKSSPMSFMPTFVLGGEYARRDDADTAFGGSRRTRYVLNIAAVAPTAELLDADRAWARAFWADLVPHATGVGSYVNFMSEFEQDRIVASYGAEKYPATEPDQSDLRPRQHLPPERQHPPRRVGRPRARSTLTAPRLSRRSPPRSPARRAPPSRRPGSAMAQLVHVPIGRAGMVLTLARTTMPGVSSTGELSGAVVIPQWVGGSPGPTESEMPGASSALNHSASALAVPWSRTGSSTSDSCGAPAWSSGIRSASVVHNRPGSERLSPAAR